MRMTPAEEAEARELNRQLWAATLLAEDIARASAEAARPTTPPTPREPES